MTPSLARTLHVEQDQGHIVQAPANLRAHHAYILLGDPGMGKSRLLEDESNAMGEAALFVPVQDFLDLYDSSSVNELSGKTLFLDGLDEARSRDNDSATSALRKLLVRLKKPRFRLSCRSAEWFGQTDHHTFKQLLPAGSNSTSHTCNPLAVTMLPSICVNTTSMPKSLLNTPIIIG